jgi:class 3 adenylate cyclase
MPALTDLSPEELLDLALELPDAGAELERRYGSVRAILVVDFSAMRVRTDAFGIVHALSTVRAAFGAYRPAIAAHSGHEIKTVADTLFASFDTPTAALAAALDGHRLMAAFNEERTGNICAGVPGAPIHPRTGLGFGSVLALPGNIYGGEVNRAFILGEDVGRDGEILASSAFGVALGAPPVGVGVHQGPHDRTEQAGFTFQVYTDYREPGSL